MTVNLFFYMVCKLCFCIGTSILGRTGVHFSALHCKRPLGVLGRLPWWLGASLGRLPWGGSITAYWTSVSGQLDLLVFAHLRINTDDCSLLCKFIEVAACTSLFVCVWGTQCMVRMQGPRTQPCLLLLKASYVVKESNFIFNVFLSVKKGRNYLVLVLPNVK